MRRRIAEAVVEINRIGKIKWQGPRAVEAQFTDATRQTIAVRFESPDGLRVLEHPLGVDGDWAKQGPDQDWFIQDEAHRGYPEIVKAVVKDGKLVVELKGGVPSAAETQLMAQQGISEDDAQIVKGMLLRGDKSHDIASWFGVNAGRVAEIKYGRKHPAASAAPEHILPPPGPGFI